MLDVLWLLLTTVQAAVRPRQDLVLENLLLRHQLAVLARRLDAELHLRPTARFEFRRRRTFQPEAKHAGLCAGCTVASLAGN